MRYFNINLSLMFSSFSQDYKFLKAITRTSFKLFNSVFFKLAVICKFIILFIPKTSGAFVYGTISFTDKLSSGVTIAIIQEMNPRTDMT